MKNIFQFFFYTVLVISFNVTSLKSDEVKNLIDPHEYNFYTGMFDFSDEGKKSTLVGIQHQNEDLYKETFLSIEANLQEAIETAKIALAPSFFFCSVPSSSIKILSIFDCS